ncbi:hypothetical protein AFLA70_211g001821 [Aspergillus flavus AF70]|nr:hypothetical protein AFLA70_211g001821 [Aspergillus flavus AF70]
METIFAKIAQETTKFDLGDEEVRFYRQTSENPSETDDIPYWRGLYGPLYPKSLDSIGAVKDKQYGPAERNRLDVFFPRDDKTKGKPVVLFVHGGGFLSGDKGWSEKLSERGVVFCSAWIRRYARKLSTSP